MWGGLEGRAEHPFLALRKRGSRQIEEIFSPEIERTIEGACWVCVCEDPEVGNGVERMKVTSALDWGGFLEPHNVKGADAT